jgi:hypothetical protein
MVDFIDKLLYNIDMKRSRPRRMLVAGAGLASALTLGANAYANPASGAESKTTTHQQIDSSLQKIASRIIKVSTNSVKGKIDFQSNEQHNIGFTVNEKSRTGYLTGSYITLSVESSAGVPTQDDFNRIKVEQVDPNNHSTNTISFEKTSDGSWSSSCGSNPGETSSEVGQKEVYTLGTDDGVKDPVGADGILLSNSDNVLNILGSSKATPTEVVEYLEYNGPAAIDSCGIELS